MEALRLAKESWSAEIEHEKSLLSQNAHSERSAMLNDIELRKRELEIESQKVVEMEISLCEKERSFEEFRVKEMINITYLKEKAEQGMEEMEVEARRVEKQRDEVEANRKDLEEQKLEMQRYNEQLILVSSRMKDQREVFMKEKERICKNVAQAEDSVPLEPSQAKDNCKKGRKRRQKIAQAEKHYNLRSNE